MLGKLLGGEDTVNQLRFPEIMADAAYVILTKDSKSFTRNFCIDEDVLKDVGVTNFDKYAVKPGILNYNLVLMFDIERMLLFRYSTATRFLPRRVFDAQPTRTG